MHGISVVETDPTNSGHALRIGQRMIMVHVLPPVSGMQEVPMTDTRGVEAGKIYTVEVERKRFQVKALQEEPSMPGWWLCEGEEDGDQLILPEASLREPD